MKKEKFLCRVPQDQIGKAGLACGAGDGAGNPERGRIEKITAACIRLVSYEKSAFFIYS